MDKKLKEHITLQVKKVYPNQKNGDCYEINSTIAYYLYDLGFKIKIIQGVVLLNKPFYDEVLEDNRPKTKGITITPDHIWIKVYTGKARRIYDFATKVFGGAKIVSYLREVDSLYGKMNKKLFKLLKKGGE